MRTKGKLLALCGLFCAMLTISAKIQIPTPLIPFTLLSACFLLCIFILPGFSSFFTISAYIFAGLIGLPVFASGGGISYVLTPSFGYLIGFLIASLLKCLIVKQRSTSYKSLLICGIALLTIVHTVGNIYLYVVLKAHLQVEITLLQSFISNGALFIPIDLAWALFCPFIIKRINKQINL
jgi:biotin transport system substrate-specific component